MPYFGVEFRFAYGQKPVNRNSLCLSDNVLNWRFVHGSNVIYLLYDFTLKYGVYDSTLSNQGK